MYGLHCNIGICPPNVKAVVSLVFPGPNFSCTVKVAKSQAAEFQSLIAQLQVTKQEAKCKLAGPKL